MKLAVGFFSLWAWGIITGPLSATAVGFHGDGSGVYPMDAPPLHFSSSEHVIWSTPMPSNGNGTPIVWGDRVFTSSEADKLLCLDAATGNILWERSTTVDDVLTEQQKANAVGAPAKRKEIEDRIGELNDKRRAIRRNADRNPDNIALQAELAAIDETIEMLRDQLDDFVDYHKANTNGTNGFASQTPVSDGERVYMQYGNGVTVCYSLDGERLWGRFVEHNNDGRGQGASPALAGDRLLLHYNSLIALDALTGELVWKCPGTIATFGTPKVTTVGETPVVVTAGGGVVRLSDGELLLNDLWYVKFGTIVVHDNVVYGAEADKAFAVRLAQDITGVVTATPVWETRIETNGEKRNYGGPIVYDGVFYTCADGNLMGAIDIATGTILWQQPLKVRSRIYGIVMAGGHIYACSDKGNIEVIKAGRSYESIAVNEMESFIGFPSFDATRMYLRTRKNLFCIGS